MIKSFPKVPVLILFWYLQMAGYKLLSQLVVMVRGCPNLILSFPFRLKNMKIIVSLKVSSLQGGERAAPAGLRW